MSDNKTIETPSDTEQHIHEGNILSPSVVSSVLRSVTTTKTSQQISSDRQTKLERAQKCLENVALVSKRIKEQRKATAELLGRPFEDDDLDTASEMASTMSEKTGYSVATDVSTALSVQDALNIPGISESLANTLKQKELLLERIKQYKQINKKPAKPSISIKRDIAKDLKKDVKKEVGNSDLSQLMTTIKEKENALSVMHVKMKALETTILDLQEKINEKDQIIEAKNMATTLMSDTLSKKEKDSLILLEDTKQQMIKMQENFVAMEVEWKQEKLNLLKEIETKEEKIKSLEEANTILEASRFEISVEHSRLLEQIDIKNKEITKLEEAIQNLLQVSMETTKEKNDKEEEKGTIEVASMVELTKKIELLEQINCQIRQTNKELENKLAAVNVETKLSSSGSPSKKGSPLPTRKGGRTTASKMKSPWSKLSSETLPQETDKKSNKNDTVKLEMLIQSLNKEILEKEYIISQKDTIISELQSANKQKQTKTFEMVDVGVSTYDESDSKSAEINFENKEKVPELDSKKDQVLEVKQLNENLKTAEEQIIFLNNEIDAANKNMIKVKSAHKLKVKQMQKTIDNFSKVSDTNAVIVKLNEELHQLSQKVAELEEEKGNLQLHLVDYDSGRLTESDIYKKMIVMENLAETRLKAISVLEAQKFDLVQELHVLQQKNNEMEDKLADISQLQSEQVCSEIKLVQLEEQVDQLIDSKKKLEIVTENLNLDKEQLNGTIQLLEEKNEELLHKLESYIQENMELTDKLEKMSAEKVSSAESIEIVESLTTQEKMELEEYNKSVLENKNINQDGENIKSPDVNLETLIEQSSDLNKKIELFTQEREEVMDKMSKINEENEILHQNIEKLNIQCQDLHKNIELLNTDKLELQNLNHDLNRQLEEVKRERNEIVQETAEMVKSTNIEDSSESAPQELQQDEKIIGDKGVNRAKSVKQLTKEILKLKNTIKDREDEIADCQMKILSLEEEQQKYSDILQNNISLDNKVKALTEENDHLKEEIEVLKSDKESEQQMLQYKHAHAVLQQEIQKVHQDYSVSLSTRDTRINELESVLLEYEKQLFNYGNTLQQKDKEINEFINQITQLNDISQKLTLTVEVLEEEKAKDQNTELVKSLNKQIAILQKKLIEYEDEIRSLEDKKSQLLSLQSALENKNISIDTELKKLQEAYTEKQVLLKELQAQHLKHSEEKSTLMLQTKERDEEIHEIKLQLRKESIENEKLRTSLTSKENSFNDLTKAFDDIKQKLNQVSIEKEELNQEMKNQETKNKEIVEKLKKFAINLKKKTSMYTDLENLYLESQKQLEMKNEQLEQLLIQVETLPVLKDKLKYAEEEINRLQAQTFTMEQYKSQEMDQLQTDILSLNAHLKKSCNEITSLNDEIIKMQKELHFMREENINLKTLSDGLNKKLAEYEIDQKNNMNFETKVHSLEAELNQKEKQIAELYDKFEVQEQLNTQTQFGCDAKIQERDLYIEGLECEINRYKNRICRLEETISVMEDRRNSLERKADQLGSQLQEKQKAYSEYTDQEDELVGRLAVLMDHDRVVEKQLHEIEKDNKDLQNKIHSLAEDNQRFKKSLSDIQEYCNTLVDKANRLDTAESELTKYQSQLHNVEVHLKRVTSENQTELLQKKKEIEELEIEFNSQIESSLKEKKIISEKYEKTIERVSELERKLQEYCNNIEALNKNLEEVNNINQELIEKSSSQRGHVHDYTEQYINEINNLNSLINKKNEEISELTNKLETEQVNNVTLITDFESQVSLLSSKLNKCNLEKAQLVEKENYLKQNNEQYQLLLNQKEEQIRDLVETKKLTFEMNIPKTEGLLISSTIESLNEDQKLFDVSSLESQIISNVSEVPIVKREDMKKVSEHFQLKSLENVGSEIDTEKILVPKKAYLCYNVDDNNSCQETDPFNSDEGWGLGESEDVDVTPGFTHLNEQIQKLKDDNDALKSELDLSNGKLIKAMKKLKELRNINEMLSNEIKISKQLSSSYLDTAIEDELRLNIQGLEKKIEELGSDLNKEKREKDALKKQNAVFNDANDRLTEIKEKLDNEIQLWKYKFKEANDKITTMQWGADAKESLQQETNSGKNITQEKLNEELLKVEKENDELQSIIDQLTLQNEELSLQQVQLKTEIDNLNAKIQQQINVKTDFVENQVEELKHINDDLRRNNDILNKEIRELQEVLNETRQNNIIQTSEYKKFLEELNIERDELQHKCFRFEEEIEKLKVAEIEATDKVTQLHSQLEQNKLLILQYEQQLNIVKANDENSIKMQYSELEEHCKKLKQNIEDANAKILELELKNTELENISKNYVEQINEFNIKIQDLNSENDNLLSTVAELRSSVSSAIDQRGFEIAELWKQHLAQREADFQKLEHELRLQLSTFEGKYEQLLDNVQSSSQEETNKLIMVEQVTSLQSKLQDKEEHITSLQGKYTELMNQLDILRSEMEDEKITHESKMLEQQEEYEKVIQELRKQILEDTETHDTNIKTIQSELASSKVNNEELLRENEKLCNKITEMNTKIVELTQELHLKDTEIYQKTHDYNVTLSQRNEEFENIRKHLIHYEKKVEDLTYEKESELAVLRLKMHESIDYHKKIQNDSDTENKNLTLALEAKITECTSLNKQIADLNNNLKEYSAKITEMQLALENQEIEIVSLKDEILDLQNVLKLSNSKIQKHVSFASDTKLSDDDDHDSITLSKELLDAVPRAELDLALYMLHQRDVRCEELTMELTQLLEERDTLQLRLSDSLRSQEELKSKCQTTVLDESTSSNQDTTIEMTTFSMEREQQFVNVHRGVSSRSSSISDPDADKPKLQAKLTELRSVKHSRDVRLRHESEQRQMDLRLLQRDVANLPPEAVDQLKQAHHTLSRDSQSTPTVLLNWLRGKSTPKVVHM